MAGIKQRIGKRSKYAQNKKTKMVIVSSIVAIISDTIKITHDRHLNHV